MFKTFLAARKIHDIQIRNYDFWYLYNFYAPDQVMTFPHSSTDR